MKAIHLKLKEFECDQCEYKTYAKRNLARHIKTVHLKIKPFKCDQCEYASSRKTDLNRHKDSVHSKNESKE